MDSGLKGKVALVSAASKGLGRASALGLAREGAHLVICSRDQAAIEETAAYIRRETGARVLPLVADVGKKEDVERFVAAAAAEYGRVDVLVSNTGGPAPGQFMQLDDSAWQSAFDSLMMSAIRLTRAAIPHMQKGGGGRVLYITSATTKQPLENLILSNALRAGIAGMAKTLSAEVAPYGITVNCVCPGRIDTDRVRFLDQNTADKRGLDADTVKAGWVQQIPMGRYGTPEEFADAVVWLASERASYITGVVFQVDGGFVKGLL